MHLVGFIIRKLIISQLLVEYREAAERKIH